MSNQTLLAAAAKGRQDAWDQLVDRYAGLVWAVVRSFRLGPADAQDVFQTTWLRLVERLDDLRNPDAVGGWLATTARHESLRVLRSQSRTTPTDPMIIDLDDDRPPVDTGLLDTERDQAVWEALGEISARCQQLLRILMADPPPSYAEVSAALDMPVGSIGPIRGRCLQQLRRVLNARGISEDDLHSS